jgi:uncharacterized hydrophobic protein (TIGR00271 family)
MLIAPLMSPILGIAAAMVMGWTARMLRLLLGVLAASVGTVALAFVIPYAVDMPRGMLIPHQVMARTAPGLEDLAIAVAAGLAGAYVQMRKEEAELLPGVAIGVSLVPPLCASGLLLYFGESALAWEATLLYLTNLAVIVLCALLVFLWLGLRPAMRKMGHAVRVGFGATATFVVVAFIGLELARQTIERFQDARDEELVSLAVQEWIGSKAIEVERVDVRGDEVELVLVFDAPFRYAYELSVPAEIVSDAGPESLLAQKISDILDREVKLIYRANLRYSGSYQASPGDGAALQNPQNQGSPDSTQKH